MGSDNLPTISLENELEAYVSACMPKGVIPKKSHGAYVRKAILSILGAKERTVTRALFDKVFASSYPHHTHTMRQVYASNAMGHIRGEIGAIMPGLIDVQPASGNTSPQSRFSLEGSLLPGIDSQHRQNINSGIIEYSWQDHLVHAGLNACKTIDLTSEEKILFMKIFISGSEGCRQARGGAGVRDLVMAQQIIEKLEHANAPDLVLEREDLPQSRVGLQCKKFYLRGELMDQVFSAETLRVEDVQLTRLFEFIEEVRGSVGTILTDPEPEPKPEPFGHLTLVVSEAETPAPPSPAMKMVCDKDLIFDQGQALKVLKYSGQYLSLLLEALSVCIEANGLVFRQSKLNAVIRRSTHVLKKQRCAISAVRLFFAELAEGGLLRVERMDTGQNEIHIEPGFLVRPLTALAAKPTAKPAKPTSSAKPSTSGSKGRFPKRKRGLPKQGPAYDDSGSPVREAFGTGETGPSDKPKSDELGSGTPEPAPDLEGSLTDLVALFDSQEAINAEEDPDTPEKSKRQLAAHLRAMRAEREARMGPARLRALASETASRSARIARTSLASVEAKTEARRQKRADLALKLQEVQTTLDKLEDKGKLDGRILAVKALLAKQAYCKKALAKFDNDKKARLNMIREKVSSRRLRQTGGLVKSEVGTFTSFTFSADEYCPKKFRYLHDTRLQIFSTQPNLEHEGRVLAWCRELSELVLVPFNLLPNGAQSYIRACQALEAGRTTPRGKADKSAATIKRDENRAAKAAGEIDEEEEGDEE